MFGKKKKNKGKKKEEQRMNVDVNAMPDVFYGGKNPLIYEHAAPAKKEKPVKEKKKPKKKKEEKPKKKEVKLPPPPAPSATPKKPVAQKDQMGPPKRGFFAEHKGLLIGGVIFLLIIAAGAWFLLPSGEPAPAPIEPVAPVVELPEPEPEPIVEPEPEPTVPDEDLLTFSDVEEPETLGPLPLTFPSILLADSVDVDEDGLTDLEEETFQTDAGSPDTDDDGYLDGTEVSNLYNPSGFAPVRIVNSGLVTTYVNPTWDYALYYPATWQNAAVDPQDNQVLFSDITGDYIEVYVAQKQNNDESFVDWFARDASSQFITDLSDEENRFEVSYKKRSDGLVAFFEGARVVYVIAYHPSEDGPINFRKVMELIVQSFQLPETEAQLPAQDPIPQPPTSTPINTPTSTTDIAPDSSQPSTSTDAASFAS